MARSTVEAVLHNTPSSETAGRRFSLVKRSRSRRNTRAAYARKDASFLSRLSPTGSPCLDVELASNRGRNRCVTFNVVVSIITCSSSRRDTCMSGVVPGYVGELWKGKGASKVAENAQARRCSASKLSSRKPPNRPPEIGRMRPPKVT